MANLSNNKIEITGPENDLRRFSTAFSPVADPPGALHTDVVITESGIAEVATPAASSLGFDLWRETIETADFRGTNLKLIYHSSTK